MRISEDTIEKTIVIVLLVGYFGMGWLLVDILRVMMWGSP